MSKVCLCARVNNISTRYLQPIQLYPGQSVHQVSITLRFIEQRDLWTSNSIQDIYRERKAYWNLKSAHETIRGQLLILIKLMTKQQRQIEQIHELNWLSSTTIFSYTGQTQISSSRRFRRNKAWAPTKEHQFSYSHQGRDKSRYWHPGRKQLV